MEAKRTRDKGHLAYGPGRWRMVMWIDDRSLLVGETVKSTGGPLFSLTALLVIEGYLNMHYRKTGFSLVHSVQILPSTLQNTHTNTTIQYAQLHQR